MKVDQNFTGTQGAILAFLLQNPDKRVTIRGMAKALKKSYTLVYNTVLKLEKRGVLSLENVPPARLISLNKDVGSEQLIASESIIRARFLEKNCWARLVLEDVSKHSSNPFFILVVFGSYAKGTQTEKSDIDIILISQNIQEQAELISLIKRTHTKAKKNIVSVNVSEFKEMISTNSFNVGTEVRKQHIILYGAEQYFQLIKGAEQ